MRIFLLAALTAWGAFGADLVKVEGGTLEGATASDPAVRLFAGVPFAAPPVGKLRWAPPQPVVPWQGVRKADTYGAHCMQTQVFDDILFRNPVMSEDCLYLTVWTPAKKASEKLPVYVWIHGGGFAAGAGDEPRQDGVHFAKQGIVVVNVNYRLGAFGFFSHAELTAESPRKASGNYGLLDQAAALAWVNKNIAAFGGDPNKVTIGGESAGSLSVSALMASELSKNLFRQSIGESGAFFAMVGGRGMAPLAESEKAGAAFAAGKTVAELRAMPAKELLDLAAKTGRGAFWPNVDGHFLQTDVASVFAAGKQNQGPLLAGWNADEVRAMVLLAPQKPTAKSFAEQMQRQFGPRTEQAMQLYPAKTDEEAMLSAGDLASDNFIVYATWKWIEAHKGSGEPIYRFRFDKKVPIPELRKRPGMTLTTLGSPHAAEIEYVFRQLQTKKADWTADDEKMAATMNAYWTNFIRTSNPNGKGLASWPEYGKKKQVMYLDVPSQAGPEQHRARYEFLGSR
jgi:para-nitrobenzyl esterase